MNLKEKFILISKKNKIKNLIIGVHFKSGRNHSGKITVRHRGSKLKKKYRIIDVYRAIWHIPFFLRKFEYDPNRNTLIALVSYSNGIYSYVFALENMRFYAKFINGIRTTNRLGSSTLAINVKKGFIICCVETIPFNGIKLLRSSGAFGKVIKKRKNRVTLRLKSGKLKSINKYCMLTFGKIMNFNYYLKRYKKAGFSRLKGFRPSVRGVAMNPVDHPYGGGEGKKSKKSILMSPWGKLMRYKKTSKNFNAKKI